MEKVYLSFFSGQTSYIDFQSDLNEFDGQDFEIASNFNLQRLECYSYKPIQNPQQSASKIQFSNQLKQNLDNGLVSLILEKQYFNVNNYSAYLRQLPVYTLKANTLVQDISHMVKMYGMSLEKPIEFHGLLPIDSKTKLANLAEISTHCSGIIDLRVNALELLELLKVCSSPVPSN